MFIGSSKGPDIIEHFLLAATGQHRGMLCRSHFCIRIIPLTASSHA